MKKFILILAVLAVATTADAKIRLGVKGGLNFAKLSYSQQSVNDLINSRTGWHVGGMMNIGLPLGFSLQPELLYSSKGADLPSFGNTTIGYVEIPVDLQWGISLPLIRPYVSVTPYVSYKINDNSNSFMNVNSWDGGIGVGAGVDVWKLQVAVKYMWGLGKAVEYIQDPTIPNFKNRNIMVSVGFFL